MIKAEDLNHEQKDEFCDYFYELANEIGLDDRDSPCPWGCPWLFGYTIIFEGSNIKKMAENYYMAVKDEIIKVLEIQEKLINEDQKERFYLEVCLDNEKYQWSNEIGDYNDFDTLEEAKEAITHYEKCCDKYDEEGNEFVRLYRILKKNVIWNSDLEK